MLQSLQAIAQWSEHGRRACLITTSSPRRLRMGHIATASVSAAIVGAIKIATLAFTVAPVSGAPTPLCGQCLHAYLHPEVAKELVE
jgi:hypothetical protein